MAGVARHFLHGGTHLVHRRGDQIGLAALVVDRGQGLFRDMGDAFGHIGELVRDPGDCFQAMAELADHAVEGIAHGADFILCTDRDTAAEVLVFGHAVHCVAHGVDTTQDHMANGHAHHHHADDQQQQLDRAADEDIAVDLLIQRLEVVADAHGAHDSVLGDLVAGQAVGSAVVGMGKDRVDHGQHPAAILLVDLNDRLARQRLTIERVGRRLMRVTGTEHLGHFIASDDARIDDAGACQDLVSQHLALRHGTGQHHGVDAVEVRVGGILGLLLDHLQNQPLLRAGSDEQRGRHDRHQHQHQRQVDLRLHGHLSRGGVVHGFP